MAVNLYSVPFLLLLSGSLGVFGKDKSKFDIDEFDYEGDPVGISCVYDDSMTEFHQINVSRSSKISWALIEGLTNGKPVSLYVDGIVSRVNRDGATFRFAKEWAKASNSNVCYLTYAFVNTPKSVFTILTISGEMIKTRRLHYAAKVGRDLIMSIRFHCAKIGAGTNSLNCWIPMSQNTVVGFSFGAYIASQLCNYLYKVTRERVGKLIGIDPAGIYLTLWNYDQDFIERGDAKYVQIIHTDPLIFGTVYQTGDVDIFVEDLPVGLLGKHAFAVYLHMATSMKKLLLIAEKNGKGKGKMISIDENPEQLDRYPNKNEVFIGVYSEPEYSKRGEIFYFSMKDRLEMLRDSIAHVVTIKP